MEATIKITLNEDGTSNINMSGDLNFPAAMLIGFLHDYKDKLTTVFQHHYKEKENVVKSEYMSLTIGELFENYTK